MEKKPINVETIQRYFRISEAGDLERRCRGRQWGWGWRIVANKPNCNGYCQVRVFGRMMLYQHIAYILANGKDVPAGKEIDHINGDKTDNRPENLRVVSRRQNGQNQQIHRAGKLVGATYFRARGKWQSQIKIRGKHVHLGLFETEAEAHSAYMAAAGQLE